jgi:lysophospholipase L1-like esterase
MKILLAILVSLLIIFNSGKAQIQSSRYPDLRPIINETFVDSQPSVKIMPLGNSITQLDWQGGYRRLLKDSLVLGGFSTDFVGSNNYGQANWANPDYEHEGYNSATITREAGRVYPHIETAAERMATYQPEIIIIELGTNDLHSGGRTPAMFRDDMRKLLDTIWSINQGIKIVLNTIPPPDTIGHANFVPLWFNVIATNALFPALVSEKVAQGKAIVLADVYTAFMPPESVKAYILDGVHPSYDGWNGHPVGGYRRMAKAIYPSVKALIDGLPILPFAPILLSPLNASTNHDTVLNLNWSPSNNANKYRLQLSTDSGFISIVHDDTTIPTISKQVNGLNNQKYYWRVKAGNLAGWGEWSGIWSFMYFDPVSVRLFEDLPGQSILYNNYPNPFNPETNIEYRISNIGFVALQIFDILGQNIATLVNQEQQPGLYRVNWNASCLPSGVYYYRLTAGEYIETKKLILLR